MTARTADAPPAITALSAHDIAQIKSSVVITSLVDVVNGLVCNSLDAESSKIHISVDLSRGNCAVEDNGVGIPPDDFEAGGGLAKAYHTSKHHRADLHGGHGIFMSSVAGVALLTITSRQSSQHAANTLICHQSHTVSRHVPDLSQDGLILISCGTNVTVRNLFGNMPVRVMQRALLGDHGEHDREWNDLIRSITGLLLAWHSAVSVILQDEVSGRKLRLGSPNSAPQQDDGGKAIGRRSKFSGVLYRNLNILTQASFVDSRSWNAWVPIAGTTSIISIKGAISLDPVPTKQNQFISLGVVPILSESGNNELYREINSIFSKSSFGVVDDSPQLDEAEQLRRSKDRRFKQDEFTGKQLRGERRGIDRWPMFFLRIESKDDRKLISKIETKAEGAARFQSILNILSAMIIQWLTENHFRPHKVRCKHEGARTSAPFSKFQNQYDNQSTADAAYNSSASSSPPLDRLVAIGRTGSRPMTSDAITMAKNSKRIVSASRSFDSDPESRSILRNQRSAQPQVSAFQSWSRIKSGRRDFYDQSGVQPKMIAKPSDLPSMPPATTLVDVRPMHENAPTKSDTVQTPIDEPDNGITAAFSRQSPGGAVSSEDFTEGTETLPDEFMAWKHPVTKEDFVLNTRSGILLPKTDHLLVSSSNTRPTSEEIEPAALRKEKSIRLESRAKQAQDKENSTDWISGLLETWKNPVFQPSEIPIHQSATDLPFPEAHNSRNCSHRHNIPAELLHVASTLHGRLSIAGLVSAEVISQLDDKFILVKMSCTSGDTGESTSLDAESGSILVIIDQHAASERCKIEDLLEELCKSYPATSLPLKSNLGHSPKVLSTALHKPIIFQTSNQEAHLLRAHAAFFATWGILYNLTTASTTETAKDVTKNNRITITALPPSILERCAAEPHHIISVLRAEAWSRTSHHVPIKPATTTTDTSTTSNEQKPTWHTHLSSCPRGILDLLNSRACRSAIMFNDILSKEQCQELVAKLAQCVFPWQCAHGRPSVVPLVALGRGGLGDGGGDGDGRGVMGLFGGWDMVAERGEEGFVTAYKRWRKGV